MVKDSVYVNGRVGMFDDGPNELHCLPMTAALSIRLPDSRVDTVLWDWWSHICLYGFSLQVFGVFWSAVLAVMSLWWLLWACFAC